MVPLKTSNGQPAFVDLAQAAHQVDSGRIGKPQIDDDEIDMVQVGAHLGEQFDRAAHGDRAMASLLERRLEAVAHKTGVVGNDDGLGGRGATRHPL